MRLLRTVGVLGLITTAAACMDMDIVNPNQPDRERALAEPGDVESLLATGFYRFWNGTQKYSPGMGLSVVANEQTSAYANYGMLPLAELPRARWDNSPTYPRRDFITNPWNNLYLGISNVAESLAALDGGMRFVDGAGTDQSVRARAYGKFTLGLSHGFLALMFDQALIFDETTDLEQLSPPAPYGEVMQAAIGYLEEAIALADANTFQLPGGNAAWINGRALTNRELSEWAHSIAARYLASVARTPAEREAVDWVRVLHHLDRGVYGDDGPEGDANLWWWATGHRDDIWMRAAYDLVGPADTTGAYQDWTATPYRDRRPFQLQTADRRIHGSGGPATPGKYVRFMGFGSPFPDERGTYLQSYYYYTRYDYHKDSSGRGLMPLFLESEADLLRAEALLRLGGGRNAAIDLINRWRVGVGELEPLPYGVDDATLWSTLQYEKAIETANSIAGLVYFDRRGWGTLPCGTPLHFPIPGAELELLLIPNYTFGGDAGGAATPATGCLEYTG